MEGSPIWQSQSESPPVTRWRPLDQRALTKKCFKGLSLLAPETNALLQPRWHYLFINIYMPWMGPRLCDQMPLVTEASSRNQWSNFQCSSAGSTSKSLRWLLSVLYLGKYTLLTFSSSTISASSLNASLDWHHSLLPSFLTCFLTFHIEEGSQRFKNPRTEVTSDAREEEVEDVKQKVY